MFLHGQAFTVLDCGFCFLLFAVEESTMLGVSWLDISGCGHAILQRGSCHTAHNRTSCQDLSNGCNLSLQDKFGANNHRAVTISETVGNSGSHGSHIIAATPVTSIHICHLSNGFAVIKFLTCRTINSSNLVR